MGLKGNPKENQHFRWFPKNKHCQMGVWRNFKRSRSNGTTRLGVFGASPVPESWSRSGYLLLAKENLNLCTTHIVFPRIKVHGLREWVFYLWRLFDSMNPGDTHTHTHT